MSISQAHHDRLVAQGRDEMMTAWLKAQERAPAENQQRVAADRFTTFMERFIEEIVGVVAAVDFPAFPVKLDNLDGKGKIVLKAANMDKAGPILITHMGASLTLVLTDVEQFDQHRDDARIEPDQRPLPLEVADDEGDEFAAEMGEIAEEGADDQPEGPLFTAVEDEPCKLPDGTVIRPWTIVHGTGMEIFVPIDAEAFAVAATDKLNALAAEAERDLSPTEVRNCVTGVLHASQESISIAFNPPYAAEATQDNAPAGDEPAKAKRGPKSEGEKVEAYFAGFDGAGHDLMTEDCPHERGKLREMWLAGLQDAKSNQPARFQRPSTDAANDDGAASSIEAA